MTWGFKVKTMKLFVDKLKKDTADWTQIPGISLLEVLKYPKASIFCSF